MPNEIEQTKEDQFKINMMWRLGLQAVASLAAVALALIGWFSLQYLSSITLSISDIKSNISSIQTDIEILKTSNTFNDRRIERLELRR